MLTHLEIILLGILWIIVGCWICYKRNWYQYYSSLDDQVVNCSFGILFAPANLVIVFFKIFILNGWPDK